MIQRKRPPQLSLHEELKQVYDDCCSLSIKNLTLEEHSKLEESLNGWKSLHTSLLFKIDAFEKRTKAMDEQDFTVLSEIKAIRDQNVKHLIRVQLRMDEINRKSNIYKNPLVSKTSGKLTSSKSVPSLRSSNPNASNSFTNSNVTTNTQRAMLKSLRPNGSQLSGSRTSKSMSNSFNGQASKAAILSWPQRPPKPDKNNVTGDIDDLFDDFDQESFEFNDSNWERIRESHSPPNLIDLDTSDNMLVNGRKLSHSMEDLTIKPVPNNNPTQKPAASTRHKSPPLTQNWKSTSDIKKEKEKPKPYVYTKPKPININHLLKKPTIPAKLKSTRSPSHQPPSKSEALKQKQPQPQNTKKLNITYNYVKSGPAVNQKLAVSNKASASTTKNSPPKTKETEYINSPTMDDLLGAYDTHDVESSNGSENGSSNLMNEKEQDELISSIRGIDEASAKQILNDIVVHGDEVYWDDIVGLEGAKNSLKEAVVYPFLRPDLFRGLREPTRGMLLFGPPGTGKTMLARAVATESKSTFFSITASSITSKYLGESEKLVRTLFLLAKKLSPSIVFIDEIDSLLSSRSENENESSRRIKNEFLIQWSELSSAAAARDKESDDRVLILGATNLPWSIDEAARRRFVRRQYIPLPEDETRKHQIIKLLQFQKNTLSEDDYSGIIELTEGFSGSDITALAKDSAMGPLRSLGDKLLLTPTENIRPINLEDFKNSLNYIRPSVSKEGLEEYEKWATKFGSSGV
ncbi:uncharacterized protein PRCAT00004389001 [Priceomyces carsonii]|uniref:uncharacterized protein n=1 Tax=Priceomyces carsonii TaxID=28549 RepID=UPI002ED86C6C|nr:unnamed protein product [Priceomyces carsonii]